MLFQKFSILNGIKKGFCENSNIHMEAKAENVKLKALKAFLMKLKHGKVSRNFIENLKVSKTILKTLLCRAKKFDPLSQVAHISRLIYA
jgi:hypothetical protein